MPQQRQESNCARDVFGVHLLDHINMQGAARSELPSLSLLQQDLAYVNHDTPTALAQPTASNVISFSMTRVCLLRMR